MAPQRRWKVHQQQLAMLEYADMSTHCPPGVYMTYHPSNPSQWTGVYFVRKGSYASAPLRFKLTFSAQHPEVPPVLLFHHDIFHPLVCPLTTYTYSTASPARQPVSSSDDQRLSPGSLNLQHQFPIWFENASNDEANLGLASSPQSSTSPAHIDPAFSDDEFDNTPSKKPIGGTGGVRLPFMPPPKADALEWSSAKKYPSIAEVLGYMVQAFEDEDFLDQVLLDAAANSSAHHAWAAYRKRVKELEAAKEAAKSRATEGAAPATPQHRFIRNQAPMASPQRSPAQWNWDGVWQERVKKSVRGATADGKLFKDVEGDDHQLITFLDREKDELMQMKAEALKEGEAVGPQNNQDAD